MTEQKPEYTLPDGYVDVTDKPLTVDEAKIILRVPHNFFDRLVKAAEFYSYPSLETYCVAQLMSGLEQKVGATHITGPANLSGQDVIKKVTGPSYSGIVSRA